MKFLYNELQSRIKRRRKTSNLSFDEFKCIVKKDCFYCGTPPELRSAIYHKTCGIPVPINGIDRSNNEIGYIKENCVASCPKCNIMKLDFEKGEFLEHIKKIYFYNF